MTDSKRTTTALGAVAAAALFTLTACGGGGGSDAQADKADKSEEPTSQESSDGGPDLSGIPDVVAEVNGEEVTKDEFVAVYETQFQQAAMQAQAGGEQPDEAALKEQTANNLVDTELLAQEAESRGISVSDEDVDAELESLAKDNQLGSVDELVAALDKQGVTEDQARSQVEIQLTVEQLVDDESGSAEPTEKELRTLYAQAKEQALASEQGQKIPPFAEVRDQLEQQAKSEEVGTVAQKLVDELRKDADITINL